MKKEPISIVSSSGIITLWFQDEGTSKISPHRQYVVGTDHPNHKQIISKLKNRNFDGLEQLCSVGVALAASLKGAAEVRNGQVYVNNVPVHNVLTDRILQLVKDGFSVEPVLRFLENCLENPSSKSIEELYDFLANRNLPLTEDGCFLAYKRVREDWNDIYSNTISSTIGSVVKFDRSQVDANRSKECSYGLHVGALDYVQHYGSGGHVLVVKVNPKNCVSVPQDYSHQKLRVCEYEVLYELEDDRSPLPKPVYTTSGEECASLAEWEDWSSENTSDEEDYWTDSWAEDDIDDDWSSSSSVDEDENLCDDNEIWGFSLDELNKDKLAQMCQGENLISNRQEGRDLGKEEMKQLLRQLYSEK